MRICGKVPVWSTEAEVYHAYATWLVFIWPQHEIARFDVAMDDTA